MVTRERELGEDEPGYFKKLKLITSEASIRLGFETEAPVFVSPNVTGNRQCDKCGVTYGPLIYQSRAAVEAHHFHPGSIGWGGIYYNRPEWLRDQHFRDGWIAMLSPIMPTVWGSSKQVIIREIRAFCRPKCCGRELSEGILVTPDDYLLIPSCGDLQKLSYYFPVKYNFKIVDGNVLFSEV